MGNRISTHYLINKLFNKRAINTLTCLLVTMALSAQISISGVITDANSGETLIGVSVIEQNKPSNGTITDFDGSFSLNVAIEGTPLLLSYIGYKDLEIVASSAESMNIQLTEASTLLDEVVVVGYGTQKRSQINGAVSVVGAEEIGKTANFRVEQALQGKSSGVQITQSSGSPGNAFSVQIRGVGTPLNSDPLYIVDGVWLDGVDFLNPSDIESISVLKDAASVAIYGTSGANGVVIITTKEGKTGSSGTISIDSYIGTQSVANTVDLLNAQEYATLLLEANESNPLNIPDPSTLGEGTDWQEEIFVDAPIQSHQISFLGSGGKTTYGITGGYYDQQGIVGLEKAQFERYSGRFKSTSQVNDAFKIKSNVNYTHFTRSALPENNEFASPVAFALNIDPITSVLQEDGTNNFSRIVTGDIKNPVNRIETTNSIFTSDRIIGSVGGELELINGLFLKTNGSLDHNFARIFNFTPSYNLDPTGAFVHERVDQNSVGKQNQRSRNLIIENIIEYRYDKESDFNFSLLAGTSFIDRLFFLTGIGLADLPSNDPEDAFITNQTVTEQNRDNISAFEFTTESSLVSYFGRFIGDYQDKYFITASLRRDGSSRFGANNKFAIFPAVSAGWLLNKDISLPENINYVKLRASWGQNGNESSLGDFGFTSVIDPVRYVFGDEQIISLGEVAATPANPDLKWEVSTQTDFGVDVGLWEDRLTFTADYFIKVTDDLLIPASILATAGSGINASSPPFQNVGSINNTGLELAVNYRNNIKKLNFDVGFNISFIENEVISLGQNTSPFSAGFNQGVGGNTTRLEVGQPLGYFYGYQTDGIFQNVFEVAEYIGADGEPLQPRATPGDFRFRDVNGDGVLDDQDQTFLGSPYPDFYYGFSLSADFAGFDLSVFINGTQGNEIVNATTRHDLRVSNQTVDRLDRWTPDNPSNTQPKVSLSDVNQNFRFSDYFVEDGSFIRLKNIQLGYTLPKDISRKVKMEKCRFYVSGQNLVTVTDYSGLDPEIGKANPFGNEINDNLNFGIDRGLFPQAKIFIAGLNIQF